MGSEKTVLTAYDMAGELGVGLNLVYRELKAGRIPATKVGDRYFISRTAWEKFLSGEGKGAKAGAC